MFLVDVQHHPRIVSITEKSPEQQLEFMNSFGCNLAVLTNQIPQAGDENGVALYRKLNDELFQLERAHPDRFVACPSIPTSESRLAMQELERVSSKSKIPAVAIRPIHGHIDLEDLDPFYEKVCDLNVPVIVHPSFEDSLYSGIFPKNKYLLGASVGFMIDTTVAISWLIFDGLLDRFPKLKILFHHLGGASPFLIGRMEAAFADSKAKISMHPRKYLKMLYFDTVAYDPEAIEYTCKLVGADHLLFGTDFGCPQNGLVRPKEFISSINSLKVSQEEKEGIFGRNAIRLFHLKIVEATHLS
ncbi:MAG: amidohydrolase family protein [Nitrososphaerales archaeon]